jgi:hypothetical protein
MKVFNNEKTQTNNEQIIRQGTYAPSGSVNLGWVKAPSLNPEDHFLLVDTTQGEAVSRSDLTIGYSDPLGMLEDETGNQAWPMEFPVVGDRFVDGKIERGSALPYAHISRYFHLDYTGLGYEGSLTELENQSKVKVIGNNGREYLDAKGEKKYSVHVIAVPSERPANTRDGLYRVWVFLDTDLENDDLYLSYHKVEIDDVTKEIKSEFINYKEPINAIEYFSYLPEESEVLDQSSSDKKVFSTKPIDLKDQIVGKIKPSYKGWKIKVPKKALPDPRRFEPFRWRVACEYSREVDPTETINTNQPPAPVNAGIITFNNSNYSATRANYLFHQLNQSAFNKGGSYFLNPLADPDKRQDEASYWHVPIKDLSPANLSKYDVLIWAPSSDINLDEYLSTIEMFTETYGGTFILESSSRININNLPGVTFSSKLTSLRNSTVTRGRANALNFVDNPEVENDSAYGIWEEWPPNFEDLWTENSYSSELLQKMNFLGGWDLNEANERTVSAYGSYNDDVGAPNNPLGFQFIDTLSSNWDSIATANQTSDEAPKTILARRKYRSGGSLYVSTGCIFEDHLLAEAESIDSSSLQVGFLSNLSTTDFQNFGYSINSATMEGEMKLRLNIMLLATAFSPSTNTKEVVGSGYSDDYERHAFTVYSDWESTWVINAHDGVLWDEEKAKFNFALLPKDNLDPEPVWQRMLSEKTVSEIMAEKINEIDPEKTNPTFKNLQGLDKRYIILVTNPSVETYRHSFIDDETIPSAWTYSFSPKFTIPADLGPHIIREEFIESTGDVGVGKIQTPPQPYRLQATSQYKTYSSNDSSVNVSVTLTGKARRTYKYPDYYEQVVTITPAPTISQPVVIDNGGFSNLTSVVREGFFVDKYLHWSDHGTGSLVPGRNHIANSMTPTGMDTWSDANYNRGKMPNSWGYWGMHGNFAQGSQGDAVRIIQEILNHLIFLGYIGGPGLVIDSKYGPITASRVTALQARAGALFVDGLVDAETWSILGYALLKIGDLPAFEAAIKNTDMERLLGLCRTHLRLSNTSNHAVTRDGYIKSSWYKNGPTTIKEGFLIKFDTSRSDWDVNNQFDMYELRVTPIVNSYAKDKTFVIDWLDVGTNLSLSGYNYSRASHGSVNYSCTSNQAVHIPFSSVKGNSVIFRISQSGAAGWGTARSLGVKDIAVLAKKYNRNDPPPPTNPPQTPTSPTVPGEPTETIENVLKIGRTVVEEVNVTVTYATTLRTGVKKQFPVRVGKNFSVEDSKIVTIDGAKDITEAIYPATISDIKFDSIVTTPNIYDPEIDETTIQGTVSGQTSYQSYALTYNGTTQSASEPNYILGQKIGDGSIPFHTKDTSGDIHPYPRSYGWVSKAEGLTLICDADGEPMGFPVASPQDAKRSESGFTRIVLDSFETDNRLDYGFYDTNTSSWLTNVIGEPEISFYDYVRRGPSNVYIAVQTDYQREGLNNTSLEDLPILRPFKWAMPAYVVKSRGEPSLKLVDPSKRLSVRDPWPITVGTGSFTRKVEISRDYASTSTNYLKDYGNKSLTAHYTAQEGLAGPWSSLLGRPFIDVENEQPRLLSQDTFEINYYPIASIREPTLSKTDADPVTPFLTVETRADLNSPWVELGLSDLDEIKVNTGVVKLKVPLADQDERLIRVSYTARDFTHKFKHDGTNKVNLNPYTLKTERPEWLDVPLYVYIKPAFIVDNSTNEVIVDSKNDRTVHVTEEPFLFDTSSELYDPTLYRLGVIYVSSVSGIDDLTILDTRVRGGGAQHHLEMEDMNSEADSYWDTDPKKVYSYQKGGFVVVRLPKDILADWRIRDSLETVVRRNLTAGTVFELQDLNGNDLFDNPNREPVHSTGTIPPSGDRIWGDTWTMAPLGHVAVYSLNGMWEPLSPKTDNEAATTANVFENISGLWVASEGN